MTNIVSYTGPSIWASYLINDDDTGLDHAEILACDDWLVSLGMPFPLSCDDAGLMSNHDAVAYSPYLEDCQTYHFAVA
jgi:hypothetical protein